MRDLNDVWLTMVIYNGIHLGSIKVFVLLPVRTVQNAALFIINAALPSKVIVLSMELP